MLSGWCLCVEPSTDFPSLHEKHGVPFKRQSRRLIVGEAQVADLALAPYLGNSFP